MSEKELQSIQLALMQIVNHLASISGALRDIASKMR